MLCRIRIEESGGLSSLHKPLFLSKGAFSHLEKSELFALESICS